MPPTDDRCSVVPVLIRHTQDTTYYATYWRQGQLCGAVRLSERPLQRADHQYSYVDSLTLRALLRTASGKEGGRNTETEVTARA